MKKLLIAVLAAGVSCCGCGKKIAEKVTEKAVERQLAKDGVKADVNLSDSKMTVKTKDGTVTVSGGGDVKVPDTFPKDVYIYDGASVLASVTVPQGQNLQLQTKDSGEKVMSAYKSKLTAEGWKEEASFNTAQQTMVSFKKGDRMVNVMAMSADGNTQITLTVVDEKK